MDRRTAEGIAPDNQLCYHISPLNTREHIYRTKPAGKIEKYIQACRADGNQASGETI